VATAADRAANRQLNPTFADAIATELVPWLRRSFAISPDAAEPARQFAELQLAVRVAGGASRR